MNKIRIVAFWGLMCLVAVFTAAVAPAQQASVARVQWEELTAPDFARAVEQSGATCILPLGIVEKHGPQLPLGTDLLNVRNLALKAAVKEYARILDLQKQFFDAAEKPLSTRQLP